MTKTPQTPVEIVTDELQAASHISPWPIKAQRILRALEAAGYRIVGPEPTDEMLDACEFVSTPYCAWEVMHSAAKKWGGA